MLSARTLLLACAALAFTTTSLAGPLQKPLDNSGCDGSGIVDPHDGCSGDGIVDRPGTPGSGRGDFQFDNPSTNCKYVSQPYIYDNFMMFQTDMGRMFTLVNRDVDFTIVGYQPVAGHYDNVIKLFVNAIRRVSSCLSDHMDVFRVKVLGIHGACDSQWSVQEVQFTGTTNAGDPFDVVNTWVTRWHNDQVVEARVYTDSMRITELLRKNEIWMNSSTYSVHKDFIPGPVGIPDIQELESQLAYPNGTKYE